MTKFEIAEFIGEKCKGTEQAIAFLKDDCQLSELKFDQFRDSTVFCSIYKVSYQGKFIKEFYSDQPFQLVQSILPVLSSEEQERVLNIVIAMQDRAQAQAIALAQAQASANNKGGVYIENKNNNENTATANATATNYNQIETLSQLSVQIQNDVNIKIENKPEIQGLISQLEQAKEDEDQNYLDLLIKLLELLSKDGIVPPVIAKGVKFIKKFFEKGA